MSPALDPFTATYVPEFLWPALLATFGRTVSYLPLGDQTQAVALEIIWKEGQSDEEVTPGRYSHIYIQNADVPGGQISYEDTVQSNGRNYDVARIEAMTVNFSRIVLQETGATV